MRRLFLVLVVLAAACGGADDAREPEIAVRPPGAPAARIHVDVVQTACCYDEGSTDILEITERNGFRVAPLQVDLEKDELGPDTFLGQFDPVEVGAGPITVQVWQEDCGSGCGWVEDAIPEILRYAELPHRGDLCALTFTPDADDVFVEARWSPFEGCQGIAVVAP